MAALTSTSVRDIEYELRAAAFKLGHVFSDPIHSEYAPSNVAKLSLEQIIAKTQKATFEDCHQTYEIDGFLADITKSILEEMSDNIEQKTNIKSGIRIEHQINKSNAKVVKEVYVNIEGEDYIVHANPIDGSDNYNAGLNHWARKQLAHIDSSFNADSCVSLVFAKKNDPFNPVASAIYSFIDKQVYGAYMGSKGGYIGVVGNNETPVQLSHRITDISKRLEELIFFIADYKYDIVDIPAMLEKSLIDHGRDMNIQIDRVRGSATTSANMLKVLIGGQGAAYLDYRPFKKELTQLKGKYASLLATNMLALKPFAESVGYIVRTFDGSTLDEKHGFDLSDRKQNPAIDIAMVPKEMAEGSHPYQVFKAINSFPKAAGKKIREHVDMNLGRGYQIPNYELLGLLTNKGTYKDVWHARELETDHEVIIKILDFSKQGAFENLEKAGMSTASMIRSEANMKHIRDKSIHVGFLYGLRHDGLDPEGNPVSYMVERSFEESFDKKYGIGQKASLDDIVDYGFQMIDGISAGHGLGVLHGDIKDENFGVDPAGVGFWTDYGISYLIGQDSREEDVSSIITRAPELYIVGSQPTERSDVFSLGCLLYKMATGFHPFSPAVEKPSKKDKHRILFEEQTKKQKLVGDYSHLYEGINLPKELKNVIVKSLQRNPEDRYANAEEMLEDIVDVQRVHKAYNTIKSDMIEKVQGTDPQLYLNPHIPMAERWLEILNPNASYASRIAVWLHDLERLSDDPLKYSDEPGDMKAYIQYKGRHSVKSSKLVREYLQNLGILDSGEAAKVQKLVQFHDSHKFSKTRKFADEIRDVVDADSLSFFQVNFPIYINNDQNNEDRIGVKVKFMYNKMSDHGKELLQRQEFFKAAEQYLTVP